MIIIGSSTLQECSVPPNKALQPTPRPLRGLSAAELDR